MGNGVSEEESSKAPRFLVDAMLGNVARDLRLLGYDAEFAPEVDDAVLLRRAQAEGRVLVTRDRALALRARGVLCSLVRSGEPAEQTVEVLAALGAWRPPGVLSRCTQCNTRLKALTPEEARDRVPDHVANTIRSYLHCPGCGRVYWHGSHGESLQRRLRRLLEALPRS
ncbi:MAG: Mut7-C RNAse domain-containing protein [Deltaproteobacteria bacterium]|nr:Mut7-C RNAse domain-containing protein [Deltaproteobacteria bacterium]